MSETKNIATMTAAELENHVKDMDEKHKRLMTTLRALAKARKAEEEARGGIHGS